LDTVDGGLHGLQRRRRRDVQGGRPGALGNGSRGAGFNAQHGRRDRAGHACDLVAGQVLARGILGDAADCNLAIRAEVEDLEVLPRDSKDAAQPVNLAQLVELGTRGLDALQRRNLIGFRC